jgi:hypothetical protein
MTPPEMTDVEMYAAVAPLFTNKSILKNAVEISMDEYQAIIAARDKQWTEMLGEPCCHVSNYTTNEVYWNPGFEHVTLGSPLYAPKREKPE